MRPTRLGMGLWLAGAGALVAACFKLSGPPSGLSSISAVIPAWPSVVLGDSLRDSTGKAAPLVIEAFDGGGQPVTDAEVSFGRLDRGLHVSPDGYIIGDSIRSTPARVVAQVRRGGDVLQTPEISIDVVPRPDSLLPASPDTLAEKVFGFTDPADITSDPLVVTLRNRALATSDAQNSGVRSWVIRYEIVNQPSGLNGQTTAFFTGVGAARVTYDTTQATGVANHRTVILRQTALQNRTAKLEVKVIATIRDLPGSPVTFIVPFRAQ